jgi:acyl carrier protein
MGPGRTLETVRVSVRRRRAPIRWDPTSKEDEVTDDATFERFKACAVEVLQVPADKIVPDARFGDDLDADSLDLVELVMALEETFDVTVEESELEGIETIGQAYELITAKI